MTLGLGKILKEDIISTNHKKKLINFPTLKQKTLVYQNIPLREKGLPKAVGESERHRSHTGSGKAQVKGSRMSGSLRLSSVTQKGFSKEVQGEPISLVP